MDAAYNNNTLTAFFDTRDDAQEAAARLRDIGIPDSSIRIVGDEARLSGESYERSDADKGFWESLGDFFFPDEDRAIYAEGLRRGGTLLTVSSIPSGLYDDTLDILDDEGTIDLEERSESWRAEGWSGDAYATSFGSTGSMRSEASTGTTSSFGSASTTAASTTSGFGETVATRASGGTEALRGVRDEEVIPVVEEELRVGKRDVNLGRVRVRSYVVETPVQEQVNLHSERVVLERRPVDRELSGADVAFTDRVIEAEEHAEEAVISKSARVTEEIALRREADERTETVSDTVRRTEVEIEDERATLETEKTIRRD